MNLKGFLLTVIVIAGLTGVYYLIEPFLNQKEWFQYQVPYASEKYCAKFNVDECPEVCDLRSSSLITQDIGCHQKLQIKQ